MRQVRHSRFAMTQANHQSQQTYSCNDDDVDVDDDDDDDVVVNDDD